MDLKLKVRSKNQTVNHESMIAFQSPESKIAEQYRSIRTNIKFSSDNQKYRSIMVTSPNRGDGKTTTAVNLGISLAQQGERVLIVDTNLRQPALHTVFNIDNTIGLSTVLNSRSILEGTICNTQVKRLQVLTSGPVPHNPAELLGSTSMTKIMAKMVNDYDVVLFDSSSVLDVADTSSIAGQCEGTILVLKKGKTKNELAIEAKRILEYTKAKLVGVIINES